MTTEAAGGAEGGGSRRAWVPAALVAGIVVALLVWLGRAPWGGAWIRETSKAHDTLSISTIYARWALQVKAGHLPLWFPEFAGGAPVHASWMYGLLYPPLLLFTVLPADAAWTWLAILHIAFGAFGVYRWLRDETGDDAGAAAGAIVFALSGFVLGRVLCGHLNLLMPFAWVPWVLHATLRTSRGERGATAVLALCAGMGLLAGHVQIWFYAAPLAAAYGLAEAWRRRDGRAVARLAVAALLTLAITAIQWIPAWELFDVSGHPKEKIELVTACAAPVSALAAQIAPRFAPVEPILGHEHLGLAGPLAAVAAIVGLLRRGPRRWYWLGVLVLGLLLATGPRNAVGEALNSIPPFRFGRAPGRALTLVVLAGSVLAAHGAADWFAARRDSVRALVPLAFVASALAFGLPAPEVVSPDFRDFDWKSQMPASAPQHRVYPGAMRYPYLEIGGVRTLREICPLDTPGYRAVAEIPRAATWWFDVLGKLDLPWRPTPDGPAETADLVKLGKFTEIVPGGPFHVFGTAQSVTDADALARMRGGDRTLLLPTEESAQIPGVSVSPDAVRVERPAPDRIAVAIDERRSPFAGWIVFAEKWYPGWVASRPEARVIRANVAMLAVRVDPGGKGGVELAYRPWWRAPALAASVTSLLAAIAAWFVLRRT